MRSLSSFTVDWLNWMSLLYFIQLYNPYASILTSNAFTLKYWRMQNILLMVFSIQLVITAVHPFMIIGMPNSLISNNMGVGLY